MNIFLDTEFNAFGGELISLAMVADNGDEWYEVAGIPASPHPWVQEHVIPHLAIGLHRGLPLTRTAFTQSFSRWVYAHQAATFVADWPADLEHFHNLLAWGGSENGWRVPGIYRTLLVDRPGDEGYVSEILHNALSDARALRGWYRDFGPK